MSLEQSVSDHRDEGSDSSEEESDEEKKEGDDDANLSVDEHIEKVMSQPLLAAAKSKSRQAPIADSPELEKEGNEDMGESESRKSELGDRERVSREESSSHFDEDRRVPPSQRFKISGFLWNA